jgi:hypothetical protein
LIDGTGFTNMADWIAGICLFLAIFVGVGMAVSAWRRRQ